MTQKQRGQSGIYLLHSRALPVPFAELGTGFISALAKIENGLFGRTESRESLHTSE